MTLQAGRQPAQCAPRGVSAQPPPVPPWHVVLASIPRQAQLLALPAPPGRGWQPPGQPASPARQGRSAGQPLQPQQRAMLVNGNPLAQVPVNLARLDLHARRPLRLRCRVPRAGIRQRARQLARRAPQATHALTQPVGKQRAWLDFMRMVLIALHAPSVQPEGSVLQLPLWVRLVPVAATPCRARLLVRIAWQALPAQALPVNP